MLIILLIIMYAGKLQILTGPSLFKFQ